MSPAVAGWRGLRGHLLRLLALAGLCLLALQGVFAVRIAVMAVLDPQSTAFQRSEAWRLAVEKHRIAWGQQWVPAERISERLQRAVIASEDAGFVDHPGVEWAAIEKAWGRNQRAGQQAQRPRPGAKPRPPKLVGGSTISQQLAKNLLLSGERTVLRKAQELVLTFVLEATLSKARILEIYLNNVEWGEGLFGAQAAARYYFRVDAARLSSEQAARLAVMLPAPKHHEKQPASGYVLSRAATIQARMDAVELP
jgi:monofunctional biosynthetic peptidoglycan transglycosylase